MSTLMQASTEIDLEDAVVARKESKNSDRELVGRLVKQAGTEGMELLGTTSETDTVNAALREVVDRRRRAAAVARMRVMVTEGAVDFSLLEERT